MQEELEHMSGLINKLLSFSKAQINPSGKDLMPLNVATAVQSVLEREGSAAETIEMRVEKNIEVLAQPEYLFRSLANLVRNAVSYAGHAGPIVVSAIRRKLRPIHEATCKSNHWKCGERSPLHQ